MGSITDYMYKIQDLTNKNLKILSAINDSFYTKREHLSVVIDGSQYIIPSYIALEHKVDSIAADLENLLDITSTGTANMTFDGNTKKIQLFGYQNAPEPLSLESTSTFFTKSNDILKDFMTPTPYIRLSLSSIPNNCSTVVLRKIAIKNSAMLAELSTLQSGNSISWSDMNGILSNYTEDTDYVLYDTERRLPFKLSAAQGTYTIKSIIDKTIDDNFEEHYTIELNEPLTYFIEDGTVERNIQVGDYLLTNNDNTKLLIENVELGSKTLTLKVLYGSYSNLNDISSGDEDKYKLHYYRYSDYTQWKCIEVPLEEDEQVCIFIAPINSELNIRAAFGTGIHIDTNNLSINLDGTILNFKEYYKTYVNNVGDTLFGITAMIDNVPENHSKEDFEAYTSYKPSIESSNLSVVQINRHLNDAKSIKNIRSLYSQKSTYKSELDTVKSEIDKLNSILSEIAFDDTNTNKAMYEAQLKEQNAKKVELSNSIAAITQEIAKSANDSEVPIENAKYHIRGFISLPEDMPEVVRVDIEYRYKNRERFAGNASTINDTFIFSDWNRQECFNRAKLPYNNGTFYRYTLEEDNSNVNEPSFNQIDIPISQGEVVDVRARLVYEIGWPFVETRSAWSDISQVEFPEEYTTNVEILDIIEENNNDVKAYQFDSKLASIGAYEHLGDNLQDQDNTYFHKPESISSGFYTDSHHIINLKEKLDDMDGKINELLTEVTEQGSENLIVTLSDELNSISLQPYNENKFYVQDYSSRTEFEDYRYLYGNPEDIAASHFLNNIAYSQLALKFYNAGTTNMKLFTMFPGASNTVLPVNAKSKFEGEDYVGEEELTGVWMELNPTENATNEDEATLSTMQVYNQWLYFRINDVFDGNELYEDYDISSAVIEGVACNVFDFWRTNNSLIEYKENVIPNTWTSTLKPEENEETGKGYFSTLFPYIGDLSVITVPDGAKYITIRPGESVSIPLSFYFKFKDTSAATARLAKTISKKIEFDLRTSLYTDPLTFSATILADNVGKLNVKSISAMKKSNINAIPYQAMIVKNTQDNIMYGKGKMLANKKK